LALAAARKAWFDPAVADFKKAVDFGLEALGAKAAGGLLGHGNYVGKLRAPATLFFVAGHGASAA